MNNNCVVNITINISRLLKLVDSIPQRLIVTQRNASGILMYKNVSSRHALILKLKPIVRKWLGTNKMSLCVNGTPKKIFVKLFHAQILKVRQLISMIDEN